VHSVEDILKRHDVAQRRKDNWRQIYEDCYEFGLPQRNLYDGYYEGGGSPGQNKMARVFDSTAINATQRFANRIQSGLFPPYAPWCRLEPGPEIPEDRKLEAQMALDMYADTMFSLLRQSNFDRWHSRHAGAARRRHDAYSLYRCAAVSGQYRRGRTRQG
jgi:hypothetical protein